MNLMIQPNQICLIVKLYNNRPELLPDSNDLFLLLFNLFCAIHWTPIVLISRKIFHFV